jgi:hypothetical protein
MAEVFRILQGSRDVDCCMKARFAITGALMRKVRRKFITGRLLERSSRILCGIFEAGVLQAVTQVFRCGAFVHSVQNIIALLFVLGGFSSVSEHGYARR